jgi:hypothetical protein
MSDAGAVLLIFVMVAVALIAFTKRKKSSTSDRTR